MEKENFEFYVDEEITTWYRHSFSVNATSLEEATALVTEAFKRGGFDEIPMLDEYNDDSESEILYDAMESTGLQELYTEDGTFICEVVHGLPMRHRITFSRLQSTNNQGRRR